MNDTEVIMISQRRDAIYEWACDRFKELIAEDRVDDAVAFADEFYEWLDPEQCEDEVTLYYNENELGQFYEQLKQQ